MFVVDVDALQAVDLLNLIDEIALQFLDAAHRQDVMRIQRTVHQRLARFDPIAFLNIDVDAARY